jgi:SAM-dependent methyltransferase
VDETLGRLRHAYEAYSVQREDVFDVLTTWAIQRCHPTAILDVGAGTGNWYRAIRRRLRQVEYTAVDVDPNMLDRLHTTTQGDPRARVVNLDVTRTWPRLGSFTWCGLHYVLHHLPNPALIIERAWRVTKPGGLVIAATNSNDHLARWLEMHRLVLGKCGVELPEGLPARRFTLEGGADYFPSFASVERVVIRSDFNFPSVEAAMDYYRAVMWRRGLSEAQSADLTLRQEILRNMENEVRAVIQAKGSFAVEGRTGFLASRVHGYVE